MNHTDYRQAELLRLYLGGEATAAQAEELFGLLESGGNARVIIGELKQAYSASQNAGGAIDAETSERMHQAIMLKIQSAPQVHRIHFVRTAWFKYAAAILLIITGVALYQIFSHTSHPETAVVQKAPPASGSDIAPGFNRATLTLSDGQKVMLDSAASETINDGTLSIENNDGQLTYRNMGVAASNTMSTPKGGQYKLSLSDGTNVWLNAASSITYPTVFTGKTREVSVTGEAYFEVKKNKEKPFIVTVASTLSSAGGGGAVGAGGGSREARTSTYKIEVLGTSFNVNAYEDETSMKVSLLEGSVKVGDTNIKPGQAYQNGQVKTTDVTQDVAWKNGKFNFTGLTIQEAMRQIARWYDVEVVYEKELPEMRLYGGIQRNLSLSQVLKGLSVMNIKYRIEGKKLILLP